MEPTSDSNQSCNDSTPVSTLFKPSVLAVPSVQWTTPSSTPASTAEVTGSSSTPSIVVSKPPANDVANSGSIRSDFVFGSNISSRVVNANVSQGASTNLWTATSDGGDADVPSSSMFTTLAKAVAKPTSSNGSKNLEDSAKGFVEDKQREALSLAEVEVITGEEGERQIVRQHCRAYIFDKDKQKWNSLGASQFHLNDIPDETENCGTVYSRSRVVVRLASTRRVIINSLVWSEMPLALVDPRSLRIGAINEDGNQVKSYLFVFPPDQSASQIHDMLRARKARSANASTNSASTSSDNNSVSGRKHKLDDESDGVSPKVSVITPQTTASSPSSTSLKVPNSSPLSTPRSNIFRPSVLDSANTQNFGSSSLKPANSSYATGEVQFRNSPLDAVVKRLKETTPSASSDSTSSTPKIVNPVNPSPNLFEAKSLPATGSNSMTGFVFGHNISDRVVNTSSVAVEPDSIDHQPDNTKSEANENDESDDFPTNKRTLEESATAVLAEMREKSVCSLPSLPESSILTGEEGECLAMKVFCQFYIFDRVKQEWNGRGKSYVHLNDIPLKSPQSADLTDQSVRITSGPPARSRLVIRVCQTLKLLANIPIRSGLNLAMADEHSLRLSALLYNMDRSTEDEKSSNTVQHSDEKPEFCAYLLVMNSSKEASRLFQAILSRLSTFTKRPFTEVDPTDDPSQSDDLLEDSCPSKLSRFEDSGPSASKDDSETATTTTD